jgi:hypothetical protein
MPKIAFFGARLIVPSTAPTKFSASTRKLGLFDVRAWSRRRSYHPGVLPALCMTLAGLKSFVDRTIPSSTCFQPTSPPPIHYQVRAQKRNLTYPGQTVSAPSGYTREPIPTVPQPRNFLLLRRRGSARLM